MKIVDLRDTSVVKISWPMTNTRGTMDITNLLEQTNLTQIKIAMANELKEANLWAAQFSWIEAATISTDRFVFAYLAKNMSQTLPDLAEGAFDPCMYDEHINDASSSLDSCIARLKEIHQLESDALSSVLDYMLAESIQPGALALAKVSLKAARKQGGATLVDADDGVLEAQDKLQSLARNTRMSMHRATGHALNYGERINFLRELYADSIRSVYERLSTARVGLVAAGFALTAPLPKWDAESSANLLNLINWTRAAIRKHDVAQRKEKTYTKVFRVGDIYPGGLPALQTMLGQLSPATKRDIVFSITPAQFGVQGTHRILKLAVALSFAGDSAEFMAGLGSPEARSTASYIQSWHRVRRPEMTFPATIRLPTQSAAFQGDMFTWTKEPIRLESEIVTWDGLGGKYADSVRQYRNANPIGEWTISFDGNVPLSDGAGGPIGSLKVGQNFVLWNIADVVIQMQIATL